jgi:mannose-1-phosphate guanylyltransferase/mannose-6-phosphate isomerase
MDKSLKIVPIILAGGTGTRLWPLSRESYPKQLLTFTGDYSLLQHTIRRIANYPDLTEFVVVCSEQHRFLVQAQIEELKLNLNYKLLLEPEGKNTAPAVAVAANYVLQTNPEANLLILAADHYMEDDQRFIQLILSAKNHVQQDYLITFGVHPIKPETGYGYIQTGEKLDFDFYQIAKFVEKPDYKTAQKYLESGHYYWNSGIFLFSAQAYLDELKQHRQDIYDVTNRATKEFIADGSFIRFDKELFSVCPSESIDYAVMEKSTKGLMIKLDVVWNDLGSWASLYDIMPKDEQQNAVVGDAMIDDCYGCYVHADSRLVAAVGLSDQVIIESDDAVLVIPRARTQQVKAILEKLKQHKRVESSTHKRIHRSWGYYDTLSETKEFIVRELYIQPGKSLSMHLHKLRTENWIILSGTATVVKDRIQTTLNAQDSCMILPNTIHQLSNQAAQELRILEVQSGTYLDADDVKYMTDDITAK